MTTTLSYLLMFFSFNTVLPLCTFFLPLLRTSESILLSLKNKKGILIGITLSL